MTLMPLKSIKSTYIKLQVSFVFNIFGMFALTDVSFKIALNLLAERMA